MGKKKARVIMPPEEKEIFALYKQDTKKSHILRIYGITHSQLQSIVRDATCKENMQKEEMEKEKKLEARKKPFKLND